MKNQDLGNQVEGRETMQYQSKRPFKNEGDRGTSHVLSSLTASTRFGERAPSKTLNALCVRGYWHSANVGLRPSQPGNLVRALGREGPRACRWYFQATTYRPASSGKDNLQSRFPTPQAKRQGHSTFGDIRPPSPPAETFPYRLLGFVDETHARPPPPVRLFCMPSMFDGLEVQVLSQPDGGEG